MKNNICKDSFEAITFSQLLDLYKEWFKMKRVVMLTSENIHVNNFMFEPLVDIS